MVVTEAFSRAFETYKKNFWDLLILSFSKLVIPVALILVSLVLLLPALGLSSWLQIGVYGIGYALFILVAFSMAMPFFAYPVVSGSIIALKKRPKIETSFRSIKDNYHKLLLGMAIYFTIVAFLLIESIVLLFVYPVFGIASLIVAAYVAMRLYFWDVLLFLGEKHPLRASWTLTEGRAFTVLAFLSVSTVFAYFIGLMSILPFFGPIVGFVLMPFFVSAKVHFVTLLKEGLKKNRA